MIFLLVTLFRIEFFVCGLPYSSLFSSTWNLGLLLGLNKVPGFSPSAGYRWSHNPRTFRRVVTPNWYRTKTVRIQCSWIIDHATTPSEECPFCNTVSMSAINVRWLWQFWLSTSVRYFKLHYLTTSCSVIFRTPICRTCIGRRLLEDYVWKFSSLQSSHKITFWS